MMMSNTEIRTMIERSFKAMVTTPTRPEHQVETYMVALTMADWLIAMNDEAETEAAEVTPDDWIVFKDESTGTVIAESCEADEDHTGEFYRLTTRDCDAGGYPAADGGFVVLEGSIASPDTTRRFVERHPGSFKLRLELINTGMLKEITDTGELLVTSDLWFESQARAASVLAGQICSANTWSEYQE